MGNVLLRAERGRGGLCKLSHRAPIKRRDEAPRVNRLHAHTQGQGCRGASAAAAGTKGGLVFLLVPTRGKVTVPPFDVHVQNGTESILLCTSFIQESERH